MLVIEGMQRALVAILIDIACAFGLGRVLSAILFGGTPHDPAVFLAAPIVLASVALVAVWVPALRVSSIDPVNALRHD
jgi:putative ABC transport system permease protein